MKRFTQQFHKQSESVKLQASEKNELRERLVSYMEYHPIVATTSKKSASKVTPGFSIPEYQMVRIPFSSIFRWTAGISAFLLVVVPFLAEQTVPGDGLYAVKVRFNEEVRSSLTIGSYEKVAWETERLNRRIEEAQLLSSEGKLTPEVEESIVAAVKEHAGIVQQEIAVLRTTDADQATIASIEFSTTLAMQSDSLQGGQTTILAMGMAEAVSSDTQSLIEVIDQSRFAQESQVESAGIPSYDKIMARVEINTTRAYELLNSLALNQEEALHRDIKRRLEDVGNSIDSANSERSQDETKAGEKLVGVLQTTQKLIVFMSGLQVGGPSELEAIVPIVLTEEEKRQKALALGFEVDENLLRIEAVRDKVSVELDAKISYSIGVIDANKVLVASSSDASRALQLAEDNKALTIDSIRLIEATGIVVGAVLPKEVLPATEAATTTDNKPAE